MKKTTGELNGNIIHILEDLYNRLEDSEYHEYDDAEDMHLAKAEVLKIIDRMIKRRMS